MHSVSERLKKLRKETGATQVKLADATGISRSSYSSYEEGRAIPPLDTLLRLADFYQISLDELVRGNTGPKKGEPSLTRLMARLDPNVRRAIKALLYG